MIQQLKNILRLLEEIRHKQDQIVDNLKYCLKDQIVDNLKYCLKEMERMNEPDRLHDDNEASRKIIEED